MIRAVSIDDSVTAIQQGHRGRRLDVNMLHAIGDGQLPACPRVQDGQRISLISTPALTDHYHVTRADVVQRDGFGIRLLLQRAHGHDPVAPE